MDVTSAQSFTMHRYFDLKQFTLPVINLGTADTSGLVADPNNNGVRYRPGVVNPLPSQPVNTPIVHNINWGGVGYVQATPQPMQIINNIAPIPTIGKWEETFILPAQDAPSQQSAKTSVSKTVSSESLPQVTGKTVDTQA